MFDELGRLNASVFCSSAPWIAQYVSSQIGFLARNSIPPELFNRSQFFKFQPFYEPVEPFEVDPLPDFSPFSEIIVENQAF